MTPPRYALLSVSDKTGLVELARGLAGAGFQLVSTGGTAGALQAAGIATIPIQDVTGHPEIMDGRVKTLHPKIHGGILGLRDAHAAEAAAHGIAWIEVVVVNLYPFEAAAAREGAAEEEVIEQIDVGGPTMIRAAAKNHRHVAVLTSPADYPGFLAELAEGGVSEATRRRLAVQAFQHTARYDARIAGWMAGRFGTDPAPAETALPLRKGLDLRYGENPHQKATFYAVPGEGGRSLARARQLQGKQLSFNNIADLDGAVRAVFELEEPGCAIIKHANPCGAAAHPGGVAAAFGLALSADPTSAYGGIVAFNRPLTAEDARAVRRGRTFFEVLAAPGIEPEARSILAGREDLRVLELPSDWGDLRPEGQDGRRVMGGWLLQDWDVGAPYAWQVATSRAPTPEEEAALRFAWRVCRSVKSNAITLACPADGGFVSNGVGAGQMSRVDSVRIALHKAARPLAGSVLASDAFFPFPDGVEMALEAGIQAFIQPGGSIRDAEVIAAVERTGGCMVLTGVRHFRH